MCSEITIQSNPKKNLREFLKDFIQQTLGHIQREFSSGKKAEDFAQIPYLQVDTLNLINTVVEIVIVVV